MIVILLLAVAAIGFVIGQLLWSVCFTGLIFLLRPEGKRAKWVALSTPIFAPLYLAGLIALIGWAWPDKNDAYETAFGAHPSPSVTVYHGKVSGLGDSITIELYFTASPTDIQAITATGFTRNTNDATQTGSRLPAVLHSVPLVGKDVYIGNAPLPEFADHEAVLIVDPTTNEAWYGFEGVH